MNKQEIEHLTKLQARIDNTKRLIEYATRGITLYCDSDKLYKPEHADLIDNVREITLDYLNDLLSNLLYQRDNLVLCRGEAEYKPIDILNNQIG